MTTEPSRTEPTRTIQFPPLDEGDAAKLLKLIPTMSELLDVQIYPKEITIKVITFEIPLDRGDVFTLLNTIANSKKKPRNFKNRASAA